MDAAPWLTHNRHTGSFAHGREDLRERGRAWLRMLGPGNTGAGTLFRAFGAGAMVA